MKHGSRDKTKRKTAQRMHRGRGRIQRHADRPNGFTGMEERTVHVIHNNRRDSGQEYRDRRCLSTQQPGRGTKRTSDHAYSEELKKLHLSLKRNPIPSHRGTAKRRGNQNLFHRGKKGSFASRGRGHVEVFNSRETMTRYTQNDAHNSNLFQVPGLPGCPPEGIQVSLYGDETNRGPPYQDAYSMNDQSHIKNFQSEAMFSSPAHDVRDENYLNHCSREEKEDTASEILCTLCSVFDGKTDLQKLQQQLLLAGKMRFSSTRSLYVFLKDFEVFHTSGETSNLDTVEEGEVVELSAHDAIIVEGSPNLQLCITHSIKAGSCNKGCRGLHVCKYFILSGCKIAENTGRQCLFGHNMNTEHNKHVMRSSLIHRFPPSHQHILLQRKYRNPSTVPLICDYYNRPKGCSNQNCQFLHVCKKYIHGECQPYPPCNLTHDLKDDQARDVLSRYGIAPGNPFEERDLVTVLNRIERDRKLGPSKRSKETIEHQKTSAIVHRTVIKDATTFKHKSDMDSKEQPSLDVGTKTKRPGPIRQPLKEQAFMDPTLKTIHSFVPNSGPSEEKASLDSGFKAMTSSGSNSGSPKEQQSLDPAKTTLMPSDPNKNDPKEQSFVDPAGNSTPPHVLKPDVTNQRRGEDLDQKGMTLSGLPKEQPFMAPITKAKPPFDLLGDPSSTSCNAFEDEDLNATTTSEDEDLNATTTSDWQWAWKSEDGQWTKVEDCCSCEEQFRGYLRAKRMTFSINNKSSEINFSTMKGRIMGESPLQFIRVKKDEVNKNKE